MLRIGRIDYANCTPIFHLLGKNATREDYRFICGVPSYLNTLLASGDLDACPSSSFEYALHPDRYFVLPQISISSRGAVASVLLLSRIPIDELGGRTVLLSSESATSVNLLKILLLKRYGCRCNFEVTDLPFDKALQMAPAVLLIGDSALKASLRKPDVLFYDLGKLWYEWTGLPFVFALWLCNRTAALENSVEINRLARHLLSARLQVGSTIESFADVAPESEWMGKQKLIEYWRDNISYELGPLHLDGLKYFFRCCVELDLLSFEPELNFLQVNELEPL
jgi:chorismate dehydratase